MAFDSHNNPVTRLKEENQRLQQQIATLEAVKVREAIDLPYIKDYDPADATDDRNDIVEYVYQDMQTKKCIRAKAKKYDAMMFLYNHYLSFPNTGKYVPKFDERDYDVNTAPCYVRCMRRNHERNIETYIKDMPLWIVVDRMLNHPTYQDIKLVRKEVWQADQTKAAQEQLDWNKEGRIDMIARGVDRLTKALDQAGGI